MSDATFTLTPGAVPLSTWRAIYRGASLRLDPACAAGVAASAATVERIVAKGEPVYGINTGFGKLASVRIEAADLETLQRNIVLSHAAGVGEATPVAITRLMMALKLASLAQGASGIRPATLALLEAMLARGVIPVVPAQGSVGASGDLAPLAHMAHPQVVPYEVFATSDGHLILAVGNDGQHARFWKVGSRRQSDALGERAEHQGDVFESVGLEVPVPWVKAGLGAC